MIRDKIETDRYTLYLGDCLDVLPTLETGTVDAVVTDPPYGVNIGGADIGGNWRRCSGHGLTKGAYTNHQDTYENFVGEIVPRINANIEFAKRAAVFSGPHIHEQRKPDAIGGVYCPAACGRHRWGFKNFLPLLLYGTYPNLHLGAKIPTAINSSAICERNGHPCAKPLEWMLWVVELASLEFGQTLDPFMGSGTTGVACMKLGRKFIGVEIDPNYFAIAAKRIAAAAEEPPLFKIARETEQGILGLAEAAP